MFFEALLYLKKKSWNVKTAMDGGIYQMFMFKAFAKENMMQNSCALLGVIGRFIFK